MHRPLFADRAEAGRRLAERFKADPPARPLVLALPRGGVPVAAEIARALDAPLDVLLVRKIGAPGLEELALGAVVEGAEPIVVVNAETPSAFAAYVESEASRQAEEIARRRALYRGADAPAPDVRGYGVIVVDDGVATGASMRAALTALRGAGAASVIAATPVSPMQTLAELAPLADRIVCLATPPDFRAVGLHYADFAQVEDAEVVRLLANASSSQRL